MIDSNPSHNEMSRRELLYAIFLHKWKMLGVLGATVAIALLMGRTWPTGFRSEAKLLVRAVRESVIIDRASSTGAVAAIQQSQESAINAEVVILKSRVLIEKVVDVLGPERIVTVGEKGWRGWEDMLRTVTRRITGSTEHIVDSQLPPGATGADSLGSAARKAEVESPLTRQQAVNRILGGLTTNLPRNSGIISMSFVAADPVFAQEVVSAVVDCYLEHHVIVHRTPGSYEFFWQEAEDSRQRLQEIENKLGRLGLSTGIVSVKEQQSILLAQIGQLTQEIARTASNVEAAGAKAASLRDNLENLPKSVLSVAGSRTLRLELVRNEAELLSLQAKLASLNTELEQSKQGIRTFTERSRQVTQLLREQEIQDARYRRSMDNLEQARIDHVIETKKISNISVIQGATLPLSPVGAPRGLLPVAIAVGLIGGVVVALAADRARHTFKRPEDVEQVLGLRPLATIPRLRRGLTYPGIGNGTLWTGGGEKSGAAILIEPDWQPEHLPREQLEPLLAELTTPHDDASRSAGVIAVVGSKRGEGATSLSRIIAALLAGKGGDSVICVDGAALADIISNGDGDQVALTVHGSDGSLLQIHESNSTASLWQLLRNRYRWIVVDVPAMLDGAEAAVVAGYADVALFVVEAERTRWEVARRAKKLLIDSDTEILGVLLNKRRLPIPDWVYRAL